MKKTCLFYLFFCLVSIGFVAYGMEKPQRIPEEIKIMRKKAQQDFQKTKIEEAQQNLSIVARELRNIDQKIQPLMKKKNDRKTKLKNLNDQKATLDLLSQEGSEEDRNRALNQLQIVEFEISENTDWIKKIKKELKPLNKDKKILEKRYAELSKLLPEVPTQVPFIQPETPSPQPTPAPAPPPVTPQSPPTPPSRFTPSQKIGAGIGVAALATAVAAYAGLAWKEKQRIKKVLEFYGYTPEQLSPEQRSLMAWAWRSRARMGRYGLLLPGFSWYLRYLINKYGADSPVFALPNIWRILYELSYGQAPTDERIMKFQLKLLKG